MEIDAERLEDVDKEWLTPGQFAALKQLVGVRFDHVWQLQSTLANFSSDWQYKEDTTINKLHNKEIRRKMDYLARVFEIRE